jgi:hypothetical protein
MKIGTGGRTQMPTEGTQNIYYKIFSVRVESTNIQDVPELAPQRKKGALGRIY